MENNEWNWSLRPLRHDPMRGYQLCESCWNGRHDTRGRVRRGTVKNCLEGGCECGCCHGRASRKRTSRKEAKRGEQQEPMLPFTPARTNQEPQLFGFAQADADPFEDIEVGVAS
jgi:hypothetical protein